MQYFCIILSIIIISSADPQPSGGADCIADKDCGVETGTTCIDRKCDKKQPYTIYHGFCKNDTCVCFEQYGNPDCSYTRQSKTLAGGTQIGFTFVLCPGVGNFILGCLLVDIKAYKSV